MPDRGHDRHRAGRHSTNEPLVAEGEQILEAAAAARDDDDVQLGKLAEGSQGLDDRAGRAGALDVRLGHDHAGRREPVGDRAEHVALRRGVVAGHEPDEPRKAGERAPPLRREEPFRSELPLQPLERREVVA